MDLDTEGIPEAEGYTILRGSDIVHPPTMREWYAWHHAGKARLAVWERGRARVYTAWVGSPRCKVAIQVRGVSKDIDGIVWIGDTPGDAHRMHGMIVDACEAVIAKRERLS